jgi:hypothetical protein
LRYLSQQACTVAREIGRCCATVCYTRRSPQSHLDDFMGACTRGGGNEAHSACVVFARGVERFVSRRGAVSQGMLAGTGRVDPLPIGGHGVS